MTNNSILLPVLGQILLTFLVWVYMYYQRIGEMFKKGIDAQSLADGDQATELLKAVVNSSDNLENLFEIPILFFVALLIIHALNLNDALYMELSIAFVIFRTLHSIIHCTYNRVMHRFTVYAISSVILWVIWFRVGIHCIQYL